MSTIFGVLGLSDTDRAFVNTIGQRVVYDATQELVARYNEELEAAGRIFVERRTEDYKLRYKLPGGGRMAKRGLQAQGPAVRAYGKWDVALPLEDYGEQVTGDRVSLAYMTLEEYQRHLDTIFIRASNTYRYELLKALLNNTQGTFVDPVHGSLSIEPLANGDSVVFPPVIGSESEATEDHYLESGYLASAISDTNNPFITIRDDLEHHFGAAEGGSDVLVFINRDERSETEDLTDFDPINDRYTTPGGLVSLPHSWPLVPGRVLGRTNGVWVAEWDFVPSGYMVGTMLGETPPLLERVDPADTGLVPGLQLVAMDDSFPFEAAHWELRFGVGAGNRLNGVVMELASGGSYSIPSGYS